MEPLSMPRETSPFSCGVAVMAKASAPGKTKTRLCPPLVGAEAAALNTCFLKDIAANLLQAAAEASIMPYMAYAPQGAEGFFRANLPVEVALIPSRLGPFGDVLASAVEDQFARAHQGACVVNADSPTLPPAYLVAAVAALAAPGDRAVIGPSSDGGYYLLGLKAPHRRLFEDIDWSTEQVYAQTLQRAAEIGLPVHSLPTWYDVDDDATLALLCGELFDGCRFSVDAPASGRAEHTRALLLELFKTADLRARLLRRPVEAGAAA